LLVALCECISSSLVLKEDSRQRVYE
jgi:hypothetical protein